MFGLLLAAPPACDTDGDVPMAPPPPTVPLFRHALEHCPAAPPASQPPAGAAGDAAGADASVPAAGASTMVTGAEHCAVLACDALAVLSRLLGRSPQLLAPVTQLPLVSALAQLAAWCHDTQLQVTAVPTCIVLYELLGGSDLMPNCR